MKARLLWFLLGAALVSGIWWFVEHMPCGKHSPQIVMDGVYLHHRISAWALRNGGNLPPDLDALKSSDSAADDTLDRGLKSVIEYHGKGLTTADSGKIILLRLSDGADHEALVYGNGRSIGVSLAP